MVALAAHGLAGTPFDAPRDPLSDSLWRGIQPLVATERLWFLLADAVTQRWPATEEQVDEAALAEERAATQVLALDRHLIELAEVFEDGSVPFRVLKGPAHAQRLWDRGDLRFYGDIDVVVIGRSFDRAAELIEGRLSGRRHRPDPHDGFTARVGKGATFTLPDGVEVDLHRTLVDGPFGASIVTRDLFEGSGVVLVGRHRLPTLTRPAMFIHACLHAVAVENVRSLIPRRDIVEGLGALEPTELAEVLELSASWRCQIVVARAIRSAGPVRHGELAAACRRSGCLGAVLPTQSPGTGLATSIDWFLPGSRAAPRPRAWCRRSGRGAIAPCTCEASWATTIGRPGLGAWPVSGGDEPTPSGARVYDPCTGRAGLCTGGGTEKVSREPSHGPARPRQGVTRWLRARLVVDRVLALVASVLVAPIVAILAVLIHRHDGGPALIRVERVGKGGKRFHMWKLRSMRAEQADGTAAGARLTGGATDDRITPIGLRLRSYHLDELPQLWNVVAGDMALLGPRPEDALYVDESHDDWRQVLAVPPGIAGPTQVIVSDWEREMLAGDPSGNRYCSKILPAKLAIDRWYVGGASPATDLLVAGTLARRLLPGTESWTLKRRVMKDVPAAAPGVRLPSGAEAARQAMRSREDQTAPTRRLRGRMVAHVARLLDARWRDGPGASM